MRVWIWIACTLPLWLSAAEAWAVSRPEAGTDPTLQGEPANYARTIAIVVAIVVAIVSGLWTFLARNSRSGRK